MELPDTSQHPKSVELNGRTFVLKRSGGGKGYYFANGKRAAERVRPSLHRSIFEVVNGPVPEGFEVHHRDDDQFNNHPSNLVAVRAGEHQADHLRRRYAVDPEFRRRNAEQLAEAQVLAAEWHRSDEGRAWHREQARAQWTPGARASRLTTGTCSVCGAEFERYHDDAELCSTRCYQRKVAAARLYFTEERRCEVCDVPFMANRHRPARTCSRKCGAFLRWRERSAV